MNSNEKTTILLGGREPKGKSIQKNLMGFANMFVKVIESIASPQKDCTGNCIVTKFWG